MCHYCHVLKNNPSAPQHKGNHCLDCANTYSKVPMVERKYNEGKLMSLLPSAPPAPSEPMDEKLRPIETKSFFGRFKNVLTK